MAHVTFSEPNTTLGLSLELPQGTLGTPDQALAVYNEPAPQPSVPPTRHMRLIAPPRRSVLTRLRQGGLPRGNIINELNNYEYSDDDNVARGSALHISTADSEDEEGGSAILPSGLCKHRTYCR